MDGGNENEPRVLPVTVIITKEVIVVYIIICGGHNTRLQAGK